MSSNPKHSDYCDLADPSITTADDNDLSHLNKLKPSIDVDSINNSPDNISKGLIEPSIDVNDDSKDGYDNHLEQLRQIHSHVTEEDLDE